MTARPFVPLLVSPDRALLRQLSKFLEVFGFDLRQATDPAQAITLAEAGVVDFLIVDAECEPRSTAQLCRLVRRLSPRNYVYALLLAKERDVATLTESLEAGFDDFLMRPVVFGELLARLRAGSRVIEFERRLLEQAGVDASSGLADALALRTRLQAELDGPAFTGAMLAILDLDAFQRIARLYGEAAASALHASVAEFLKQQFAACDPQPDFVALLHPNRFALLSLSDDLAAGAERLQSIGNALAAHPFAIGEEAIRLTASCGLALLDAGERAAQTLDRATRALELAKASGRACVMSHEDVEQELENWTESAAAGRLFETTLARDVMLPCPVLLGADDSLDYAHAQLTASQLELAAVVDADGRLLGIARRDEIDAKRPRGSRVRSSSVRLLRHVLSADVSTFEETATLGVLMEFFTQDGHELAVVVRDKRPLGIVTCQGLGALNERLAADRFVPCGMAVNDSSYLVVPDLAAMDNE